LKKMSGDEERAAKRLKTMADVNEGKRYQLWGPGYSKEQRADFQMDATSIYSVTDARTADRITKIMQALSGGPFTHIMDGCACVGGNVLSFGRALQSNHQKDKTVSAIEFDHNRYNMLCHNVKVAKLNDTIRCYHGDFAQLLNEDGHTRSEASRAIKQSQILFLDPPWGGRSVDTAQMGTVELTLGGLTLPIICSKLLNTTIRYVLFKLPSNYNFTKLENELSDIALSVRLEKSLRKMILVVVALPHRDENKCESVQIDSSPAPGATDHNEFGVVVAAGNKATMLPPPPPETTETEKK